jgi:hypothetical protein
MTLVCRMESLVVSRASPRVIAALASVCYFGDRADYSMGSIVGRASRLKDLPE